MLCSEISVCADGGNRWIPNLFLLYD